MIRDQFTLDLQHELIVDNFAGGGGASIGIELALGRHVDHAINHDPEAVAMHALNHPQTAHHCESVWDIDSVALTQGRPVGLAWFSPDCKHFSKAKGGRPRDQRVRGLAWVAVRWADQTRPRVIVLENVEEFQTWGPLLEDGTPCPQRRGETFRAFVQALRKRDYAVEWRELRACDFGAPTTRKRLFLIARRDRRPIVWPSPTHGAPGSGGVKARALKPWRTAAECIDWQHPVQSIFGRTRPLAEASMQRILRGVQRWVIDADRPFVVDAPVARRAGAPDSGVASASHELVSALLVKHYGGNYAGPGAPLTEPMHTVTTQDHHALTCAFLTKYYGEGSQDQSIADPLHTIPTVDRFGLVTIERRQYRITDIGMRMLEPRELYRAQGFPESYRIDPEVAGRPLPKRAQVRMCGNSVSPPLAAAIVRANVPELMSFTRRELRQLEAA